MDQANFLEVSGFMYFHVSKILQKYKNPSEL